MKRVSVMSIIKVELRLKELVKVVGAFRANRRGALEALTKELRDAVSASFNELLEAEIDLFLGTADQSNNKKNGFHDEREYVLKGLGGIRVRVPRDRQGCFESRIIPAHERMDPRIKADMAILHLAGLSTRTLQMISRRLLGVEVSKDSVSASLATVHEEAVRWLERPITEKYFALYVDGTNFKVQRRGSTSREPSLVVLGVDENNYRSILAIEPGTKDNVDAWRSVFSSLRSRGLSSNEVQLGVMDGLPGLEKLFRNEFPNAKTQRCWVHAKRNAVSKCPARIRDTFSDLVSKVMYSESEKGARASFSRLKDIMQSDAGRAVRCLEKDLDSLVTYYGFDKRCWTALRTTNAIETINRQFKRRTKGMDTIGEQTLESVLAFTALKIELNWRKHAIDSGVFNMKRGKLNVIEGSVAKIGLVN